MREMAASDEGNAIGCTQITEIKYTPGVALVGPLPVEFELSIENVSSEEVYVQSGDIVKGGQQDRMMAVDLILLFGLTPTEKGAVMRLLQRSPNVS